VVLRDDAHRFVYDALLLMVCVLGGGAMTRVLLVDDHDLFRQSFSLLLERHLRTEVAEAGSLAEARQKLGGVDFAVLDIALPDGDGIELISELRTRNPNASVLVLSAALDSAYPERAFEAGADAVLQKAEAPFMIVDEIERLRNVD
jgi:DNA-binding NarL/FixJ family response regulator